MNIRNLMILAALVSVVGVAQAEQRNCLPAAKAALSHPMNNLKVKSVKKVGLKERVELADWVKTRNANELGLSPNSKVALVTSLLDKSSPYQFFVGKVQSGPSDAIYLVKTDAGSCAPYDPIRLK